MTRTPATADREVVRLDQPNSEQQVWTLYGQRMKHSVVDLSSPTTLVLDYVQMIADVIDAMPDGPLRAVHIGGGARTLARYLGATRPGSTHRVIEPHPTVNALAAQLPAVADICGVDLVELDGRAGLMTLGDRSADLVVLDAFADCQVPASLTTLEAMIDIARVLSADGVFVANLLDTADLHYLHRVMDTMQRAFTYVTVAADRQLGGRGFGNIVVAASQYEQVGDLAANPRSAAVGACAIHVDDQCPDLIAHLLTDAYPLASPVLVF